MSVNTLNRACAAGSSLRGSLKEPAGWGWEHAQVLGAERCVIALLCSHTSVTAVPTEPGAWNHLAACTEIKVWCNLANGMRTSNTAALASPKAPGCIQFLPQAEHLLQR